MNECSSLKIHKNSQRVELSHKYHLHKILGYLIYNLSFFVLKLYNLSKAFKFYNTNVLFRFFIGC